LTFTTNILTVWFCRKEY